MMTNEANIKIAEKDNSFGDKEKHKK